MTVHTAACATDLSSSTPIHTAPAAPHPIAAAEDRLAAKLRDTFAALHDITWRAPWDDAGQRWVNLR